MDAGVLSRERAVSPVRLLIGLRGGIGLAAVVAPGLAARLLLLDSHRQLGFLVRVIGIRDLALALGTAMSGEENQRLWLSLGLLCDATDGVAGIIAYRERAISKLSTALVTAPAALGCAMGLAALERED
jgi:hypothetical protein